MIIEVPFFYDATLMRPRKRNPETVQFRGTALVDIQEVASSDAPVALRVPITDRYGIPILERDRKPFREKEDFRLIDGQLYRLFRTDENLGIPEAQKADWLRQKTEAGNRYDSPLLVGRDALWGETPGKLEDDGNIRELLASDREELELRIQVLASEFLIIDGWLWTKTPEPRYAQQHTYNDIPLAIICNETQQKCYPTHIFRADQREFLAQVHLRGRFGEDLPEELQIDVILPEVLQWDVDGEALRHVAHMLTVHMKDRIASRDGSYFEAFRRLRDQGASASAFEPTHPEELLGDIESATEFLRVDGTSSWLLDQAEEVMQRFSHRDPGDLAVLSL